MIAALGVELYFRFVNMQSCLCGLLACGNLMIKCGRKWDFYIVKLFFAHNMPLNLFVQFCCQTCVVQSVGFFFFFSLCLQFFGLFQQNAAKTHSLQLRQYLSELSKSYLLLDDSTTISNKPIKMISYLDFNFRFSQV